MLGLVPFFFFSNFQDYYFLLLLFKINKQDYKN